MDDLIRREDALLPCPFCGCLEVGYTGRNSLAMVCTECGASGESVEGSREDAETWDRAYAAWNRRTLPAAPQGWQPIETAPDRQHVLMTCGSHVGVGVRSDWKPVADGHIIFDWGWATEPTHWWDFGEGRAMPELPAPVKGE